MNETSIIYTDEAHPELTVKNRGDRTWASWAETPDRMGVFLAFVIESERGFEISEHFNDAHDRNPAYETIEEAARMSARMAGFILTEAEGVDVEAKLAELDMTDKQSAVAWRFVRDAYGNFTRGGRTEPEIKDFEARPVGRSRISIAIRIGHIGDERNLLITMRDYRHVFVGRRGGIELVNAKRKDGNGFLRTHPTGLRNAVHHPVF